MKGVSEIIGHRRHEIEREQGAEHQEHQPSGRARVAHPDAPGGLRGRPTLNYFTLQFSSISAVRPAAGEERWYLVRSALRRAY